MHRFFVPPAVGTPATLELSEGDSHHATRVLRLEPGAKVELLDGVGRIFSGRISVPTRRCVEVAITGVRQVPAPPRIVLAPALLKGKAMDWLVQKATELGVAELRPLALSRCVAVVKPGEAEDKVADWTTTAREACKQCGNPWLPRLHSAQSLKEFLSGLPAGLLIVASLGEGVGRPRALVESARASGAVVTAATLVLGPEGDLTPEEERLLRAAGARPMTLGPLVLRAETAALAGLAVLQQELSGGERPTGSAE